MVTLARPTDEQLVAQVVAGDRTAFDEVLRRFDDQLRGLAYKLLGGDRHRMDDALQEAYLNAYRALPRFRRDAHLGSWLYRITFNACMDELRRVQRRPEPVDAGASTWDRPSGAAGPERAVVASDAVVRALALLPDDQRVTVVLVDGEGFDNGTAAEILGVAPGTVASRLSRARAVLRQAIEAEERG